jgi:pimeloyl-ACP methyl ester carboxylesterase
MRLCHAELLFPLLLIASCETTSPAVTSGSAANPRFEQHTCTIPNDATLAARMRCGTVRVPRDYAHPDGPSFALSVVVIDSEQKPALPDPVVYINGGPGEPITVYAAAQAKTPYASGRDLVLIDQRGTGGSEPRICPTMDRKLLDVTLLLGAEGSVSAADARHAAFDACRREALSRGFDLSNFGTRVTADDFESVRRALNIVRWNLYGESYGTDVAMTLAALHPTTVRSMVLDSMYPPDPRPSRASIVAAARTAFFELCDSDTSCFEMSGGLARAYDEAKAQLAREPLILTRPPGSNWTNERFVLTASAFELVVANLLYYRNAYPTVPLVIMWAKNGAREPLASVTAKLYEAALTRQVAANAAVECRDRPHFRGATAASDDIFARTELSGLCDTWAPLGPPLLIPAASIVPTLILAGAIDPVAEPHESRSIGETIGSNAQWIEFPEVGHNVRAFSPCARRIVADFIAQPQGALDDSCALHPLPLQFNKTPRQQ